MLFDGGGWFANENWRRGGPPITIFLALQIVSISPL